MASEAPNEGAKGSGPNEARIGPASQRHRLRRWETRVGTLILQVPKLPEGGYAPSLVKCRRRSELALISVIQEASVKGVSTRKIGAVLEELGIASVSTGRASQLCLALDEEVRQFRERTLGQLRYVWVDALYEKVEISNEQALAPGSAVVTKGGRIDERVESMANGTGHGSESERAGGSCWGSM